MFYISNFFVSLPDTFKLALWKKKWTINSFLFPFIIIFVIIIIEE